MLRIMNPKQTRQIAIQYHILRRLIQDDHLLNSKINKDTIHELLDAKKFYEKYFDQKHNLSTLPTLFKLIQRETDAAFKRISNKIQVIHRYDSNYPISLIQDFREEAPMFIYLSGKSEILDRKIKKISLFTNAQSSEAYIEKTLKLIKTLKGSPYIALIQFNTLMDNLIFLECQKQSIPCIVIFRGPITKDLENAIKKYNPLFKRGLKGMNIMSITSPFNEVILEKKQNHLMNSLGRVSILFSEVVNDVNHDAVKNNLSWRKPVMMPLLSHAQYPSSELLFTLGHDDEFKEMVDRLSQ